MKTQAPAPHGPGFPRHDPSVNATAVVMSHLSSNPPITSQDSDSCSADLDLGQKKCLVSGNPTDPTFFGPTLNFFETF